MFYQCFIIAAMATKRPVGKDFDAPGVPSKQAHIESSSALPLPGQQPVLFPPGQPVTLPIPPIGANSPRGPSGGVQPSLISLTGIPSSSSALSSLSTRRFEFPSQASSSIANPGGIIPLPPQAVRFTPSRPTSIPHLTTTIPGISSLHRSTLPSAPVHYSTDLASSNPLITSQSSVIPQVVGGPFSLLSGSSATPDAPPPPYPAVEGGLEEIGCSSPSQFLYSPTSIHSATPAQVKTSSLESEEKSASRHQNSASESTKESRLKLVRLKRAKMLNMKKRYEDLLREKFFLEAGGNMMDYQVWKKRPNILKEQYMKQHDLDSEPSTFEELLSPRDLSQPGEKMDTEGILDQESPLELDLARHHYQQQQLAYPKHRSSKGLTLTARSSIASPAPTTLQTPTGTPLSQLGTPHSQLTSPSLTSPRPPLRSHSSISSVAETSHEDIVMRARHEAEVMKAISELRKEGIWSASRLPKVQEPSRIKTHWDYLLEEMHWLATDFHNERRWKINAAKKVQLLHVHVHMYNEYTTLYNTAGFDKVVHVYCIYRCTCICKAPPVLHVYIKND